MAAEGTRLWEDANLNGYLDNGELMIPNVLVESVE
jgi:hypothetical protein